MCLMRMQGPQPHVFLVTDPLLWGRSAQKSAERFVEGGQQNQRRSDKGVPCSKQHSRLPTREQCRSVWHGKEPGEVYLQPVDDVLD